MLSKAGRNKAPSPLWLSALLFEHQPPGLHRVAKNEQRERHFVPPRGSPGFRSAIDRNLTQSQRPARVAGEPLFLVNSVRISRAALNELHVRLGSSGRL